jgi:DNA polymerase-3 subunit alpha
MINNEMRRLGLTVAWPRVICTVEETEHLKGHRLKLSDLYELLFGEKFANAHDAKADVEALAKCYFELVKRGEI